jgi:hypothetical protein
MTPTIIKMRGQSRHLMLSKLYLVDGVEWRPEHCAHHITQVLLGDA